MPFWFLLYISFNSDLCGDEGGVVGVVDEDTDGAAGRDLGGGVQGRQTELVRRHVQVLHTHTRRGAVGQG